MACWINQWNCKCQAGWMESSLFSSCFAEVDGCETRLVPSVRGASRRPRLPPLRLADCCLPGHITHVPSAELIISDLQSMLFVCARSLRRINHSRSGWDNLSSFWRIGLTSDQMCLSHNNLLLSVFRFCPHPSRFASEGRGEGWCLQMKFGFDLFPLKERLV